MFSITNLPSNVQYKLTFYLYYTYFLQLLTFFITSYMAWCYVAGRMASVLRGILIWTAATWSLFLNYMSTFQPRQDSHLCSFIFRDLWIAIAACCRALYLVSQLMRPTQPLPLSQP